MTYFLAAIIYLMLVALFTEHGENMRLNQENKDIRKAYFDFKQWVFYNVKPEREEKQEDTLHHVKQEFKKFKESALKDKEKNR